jgi:hypothetical protein
MCIILIKENYQYYFGFAVHLVCIFGHSDEGDFNCFDCLVSGS